MTAVQLNLDENVDAAITESFEGMAFADAQRRDDGDFEWNASKNFWARIRIERPVAVDLCLVLPEAIAREIGDAVMGELGEVGEEEIGSVMGELINTLVGVWLTQQLAGGDPPEIGIPETGRGEWNAAGHPFELAVYEIDEVPFGFALRRADAD